MDALHSENTIVLFINVNFTLYKSISPKKKKVLGEILVHFIQDEQYGEID